MQRPFREQAQHDQVCSCEVQLALTLCHASPSACGSSTTIQTFLAPIVDCALARRRPERHRGSKCPVSLRSTHIDVGTSCSDWTWQAEQRCGFPAARNRAASQDQRRSGRSEEHTSELQSPYDLVCRLLLEKKNKKNPDGRA